MSMPSSEVYLKISEWLDIYHSTDNIQKKTQTKSKIVSKMMPVVKNIARTIARRATDPIEDMIQAGCIGLLKAIDRYSKEKNDNFRVYAGYFIIGEMRHYLRDKLNLIRVPRHIQELVIRINNFTRDLTYEELVQLTSDDVAAALDVPTKSVDFALQMDRRSSTLSLDDVFKASDESLSYEEIFSGDDYKQKAEYADVKLIYEDVIGKLPDEDQVLLEMFYNQDMSQKEIAEALQLTPMSVSRKMKNIFNLMCDFIQETDSEG